MRDMGDEACRGKVGRGKQVGNYKKELGGIPSQLGLGLQGRGMNTQRGLLELLPLVFENGKKTKSRVQVDWNKCSI